jgi:hypothetical protein
MVVEPNFTEPDAGPGQDGGTRDGGTNPGQDGEMNPGQDAGTPGPAVSALGWSCGASGSSNGALALGALVGLVLFGFRSTRPGFSPESHRGGSVFRRVFGVLATSSALLLSWDAVGLEPVFLPGIAPAPVGSAGRYELRHSRSHALFTDRGVELSLSSPTREVRALGWSVSGGRSVTPRVEKPRQAKMHRLMGARESWGRELPTYGGLRYPGVLPGVDLWFEERAEGMEYGFRAERGADLRRVQLEYVGAQAVRVVEEGRALEVALGEGVLREQGLHCEQEQADGTRKAVGCRFTDARPVGRDRWTYAIEVDVEEPERPVVVDPLVIWNSDLGSRFNDALRGLAQNADGELILVGSVGGPPVFPQWTDGGTTAPDGSVGVWHGGTADIFVAKFQTDGGLAWSTLIGGNGEDEGRSLFVGTTGEIYVAGNTASTDIQVSVDDGGTASAPNGTSDGFVGRLTSDGRNLDWALLVGGSGAERINKVIPGPLGKVFIAGETTSGDLPKVVGTAMGPIRGWEGFAARVDLTARRMDWSVTVQGTGNDTVNDIAYREALNGILYMTGGTQPDTSSSHEAYLKTTVGATMGTTATYAPVILGGSNVDEGRALSLTAGDVVVWGETTSATFPGAGSRRGLSDIFVAVFGDWASSNATTPLRRTSLLGGVQGESLYTVAAGPPGLFYLGGSTTSTDLPVDGGFDTELEVSGVDGFVMRVRLGQEPTIEWASLVGGTGFDEVLALKLDDENPDRLFIGGVTTSSNLKYSNQGYNPGTNAGGEDMFLVAVDLAASPDAGTGTPDSGTPDSGTGTSDSGTPGLGADGGTGSGAVSPLGWSCGASGSSGGVAALALGSLAGLVLLASRRRPRA